MSFLNVSSVTSAPPRISTTSEANASAPLALQRASSVPVNRSSRLRTFFLNVITLGLYSIIRSCRAARADETGPNRLAMLKQSASTQTAEQSGTSASSSGIVMDTVWKNRTLRHPRGVCEAATVLWIRRIAERGLAFANELQPKHCDELQSRVERGWIHSLQMGTEMPSNVTLHMEDGMFAGIDSPISNCIRGGSAGNSSVPALLDTLNSHDFFYVDATGYGGGTSGGHAMAVFRDGDQYHFFDPDRGICHGTRDQIAAAIQASIRNWSNVVVSQGHIR